MLQLNNIDNTKILTLIDGDIDWKHREYVLQCIIKYMDENSPLWCSISWLDYIPPDKLDRIIKINRKNNHNPYEYVDGYGKLDTAFHWDDKVIPLDHWLEVTSNNSNVKYNELCERDRAYIRFLSTYI